MRLKTAISLVVALQVVVVIGWAGAEEIQGRIRLVDKSQGMIAFENGVKMWVAEGLSMETLKEGSRVKAFYEERDGDKVVTSIEVE
jgi:hypothetical protein